MTVLQAFLSSTSNMDYCLADVSAEGYILSISRNRTFMIDDSLARNMFIWINVDCCLSDVTSDGFNDYIESLKLLFDQRYCMFSRSQTAFCMSDVTSEKCNEYLKKVHDLRFLGQKYVKYGLLT